MFSPSHAVSLAARKVPNGRLSRPLKFRSAEKHSFFRVCLALGNNLCEFCRLHVESPCDFPRNRTHLTVFPRIYKNVYCSGTTIKLTILHKDPSVKGFSCVFSHFCASLRQIFLLLSSHGLSLENRTDIWRCLPPSDFPEKAFSGKFGKSGQAPRRQARKMGIPPGSPALS